MQHFKMLLIAHVLIWKSPRMRELRVGKGGDRTKSKARGRRDCMTDRRIVQARSINEKK